MLRVKEGRASSKRRGITEKRQVRGKQMMEGEGNGGKRHRKWEQGEKKNLPGQGSSELVHSEGQGTAVEGEELLAGA